MLMYIFNEIFIIISEKFKFIFQKSFIINLMKYIYLLLFFYKQNALRDVNHVNII
jgi:hypothetical protein